MLQNAPAAPEFPHLDLIQSGVALVAGRRQQAGYGRACSAAMVAPHFDFGDESHISPLPACLKRGIPAICVFGDWTGRFLCWLLLSGPVIEFNSPVIASQLHSDKVMRMQSRAPLPNTG